MFLITWIEKFEFVKEKKSDGKVVRKKTKVCGACA